MAIEILKPVTAMSACQQLAALVTRHTDGKGNGAHKTAITQLEFMRESVASTAMCGVAEPTRSQHPTLTAKTCYFL